MRIIPLIIAFWLLCLSWCFGQDVKPGQQAQGYLENKHITVDRTTGIFHYSLPLYTVGMGDFSLPLSADYSAKGLKKEDVPGLLGYNWTLNTGGIVTRTVRGGIADETAEGYLNNDYSETGELFPELVNQRQQDGGCDIFTAMFNGQSVSFILQHEGNGIRAVPLEKTGVKIEAINPRYISSGWIVTDEMGNRYIFQEPEYSHDVSIEEAISYNHVTGKEFVSSWHLTRIEPYNGLPVEYSYLKGKRNQYRASQFYQTTYHYGKPMVEYPFDFEKYREEFEGQIDQAKSYLSGLALEIQLKAAIDGFMVAGQWIQSPDIELHKEYFDLNHQVMGQIVEFDKVAGASQELVELLDALYETYHDMPYSYAWNAAACFDKALAILAECIEETRTVDERTTTTGTAADMDCPMLEEIRCGEQVIRFLYGGSQESHFYLSAIECRNAADELLSSIEMERDGNTSTLTGIRLLDENGKAKEAIAFTYYPATGGLYDLSGYRYSSPDKAPTELSDATLESTQGNLMESITLPDGGKVRLAYELNSVEGEQGNGSKTHGGVRLKHIATEEPANGIRDTTFYEYLKPGIPVYYSRTAAEEVYYSGFKDDLSYSRAIDDGSAFLKTGNNGVYYPEVKETLPGRGSRVYRYHIPRRHSNLTGTNGDTFFPFHLYGIPLAVEEYDAKGTLQEVTKYLYYTDCTLPYNNWHFHENATHFYQGPSAWDYTGNLPQIQANRFYMDRERIEQDYRKQGNVELYNSERQGRMLLDVYDDIYVPNLQPRMDVLSHVEHCSSLRYGGATVPMQVQVFRMADDAGGKGTLVSQTTYSYDNPGSAHPTRTETSDAQGNATVTTTERVAETDESASPAIQAMREQNVLQPVVRKAVAINGKLQGESVNEYKLLEIRGNARAVASAAYSYFPDTSTVYDFSYPSAYVLRPGILYFPEVLTTYDTLQGMALPASAWRRDGTRQGILYDRKSDMPILRLDGTTPKEAAVASPHRYVEFRKKNGISGQDMQYVEYIRMWENIEKEEIAQLDVAYLQEYFQSGEYALVRQFIALVAAGDTTQMPEIKAVLEQLRANDDKLFKQFINMADQAARYYTGETTSKIINSSLAVWECGTAGLLEQTGFRKAMQGFEWTQETTDWEYIPLDSIADRTNSLKLFILADDWGGGATIRIRQESGDTYKYFSTGRTGHGNLKVFDIPLYEYDNPQIAMQVDNTGEGTKMAVLVPENAVFSAVCLNLDGTVHAAFDQGGYVEFYEYEDGGTKVTTRDGNGNILSESRTHSCSTNN